MRLLRALIVGLKNAWYYGRIAFDTELKVGQLRITLEPRPRGR